nr:hypothetical protein [uncultured Brevundimonas sp.]
MAASLILGALAASLAVLLILVARGLLSPRQFAVAAAGVCVGGMVGACLTGGDHG